nr:hypothetical protein [Tanacetum cinerariifolium]
FNHLLEIDAGVLTGNLLGFKTYEDYKNTWIYEWNIEVPWVEEKPWLDNATWKELNDDICHEYKPFHYKSGHIEWPTCNSNGNRYCNRENLSGMIQEDYFSNYQELDYELMRKLEEYWWGKREKEESRDDDDVRDLDDYLIPQDASYYVDEEEESFKERKSKLLGTPYQKPPTLKFEKFE